MECVTGANANDDVIIKAGTYPIAVVPYSVTKKLELHGILGSVLIK